MRKPLSFSPAVALLVLALMGGASARACAPGESEIGKRVVLDFLAAVIDKKDVASAERLLGPQYIQHNPSANGADGKMALKGFIGFLRARHAQAKIECQRIVAEGDLVVVHSRLSLDPGLRPQAVADIFRLTQDHKIIEHWDVIQKVPEKSTNPNGMF